VVAAALDLFLKTGTFRGSPPGYGQKWLEIPIVDPPTIAEPPVEPLPLTPLDVSLNIGIFRGISTEEGTEKWLGIPFAQPPVGPLRFKAPVPVVKLLEGINNAFSSGHSCPQPRAAVAEDCLFLNVRDFDSAILSIVHLYNGADLETTKHARQRQPPGVVLDSCEPIFHRHTEQI
jgi:hypothetical protein